MGTHVSQIVAGLRDVQLLVAKLEAEEKVPRIELDLALTKLQNVYDFLLHEANNMKVPKIGEKHPDKIIKSAIMDKPEAGKEEKNTEGKEDKVNTTNIKSDDGLIFIDDKKVEIETKTNTEKEKHTEHGHLAHEHHKSKEILAEKFNTNQQLINEKLAQGIHRKDISGQMQAKALKNIEAAIGINEKFLFVRELFNGDTETFHKTIRILNNAANFNEAFNYIHSTFNWDLENEAAQKLLDLTRRRFIFKEE
jgi:hypothetical protein